MKYEIYMKKYRLCLISFEQDNFSSFWMSVVKVFVMMVGEMDYSDMLSEHVVNNNKVPGTVFPYVPLPVLTYLIFTLFVLTVSIILMNLLVSEADCEIEVKPFQSKLGSLSLEFHWSSRCISS